jgi:ankyrin repeat protein
MSASFDRFVAAVKDGRVEDVHSLLASDPAITRRINEPHPDLPFDSTPLLAAVARSDVALIDLLLAAGADINAKSRWWAGGFGVLHTCSPELAPFLIERGAAIDLHAAARLGLIDDIDRLLYADRDLVHARGGDGQTPLHFAMTTQVARRLLDVGADIDARDVDHESTPAQWMVSDRADVARYLISRGCQTDILMTAALGDLELTRRHLDSDPASIRTRVSERYFPKRDPRAGGTVYNWTLGGNKTAHAVAYEHGHEEVYQLLMKRSPSAIQLVAACEVGDEPAVGRLLESEPTLPATLEGEDRARLAFAAESNDARAVGLMLRAGWPLDGRGTTGGTALHWASWHGNAGIVREILQFGPDIEARDGHFGATPLGWAIHGSLNSWHCRTGDYGATVDALLDAGARPPDDLAAIGSNAAASDAVRDVFRRRRLLD